MEKFASRVKASQLVLLMSLGVCAACTAKDSTSPPQPLKVDNSINASGSINSSAQTDHENSSELHRSDNSMMLSATAIYAASECGTAGQGSTALRRIENPEQLALLYQQLYSNTISDTPVSVPQIDFSSNAVLFISMGQKNTGGYAIRLAGKDVVVKNATASVVIDWLTPSPGAMTMQVLTNPCLLFSIPLADYNIVELVDQYRKVRASLELQ